ncbi:putative oxidoreductase-like protein [Erysiphe neolycopersici]|uniref:Putative oxidoreductase-like protein n=1 Tax=Erysiphe neolycopersici TaxID=212602 RepID=A0A420HI57_9PEZI|nr:putative oxidoreductase-like protein [Erysiphe neolycopersici]
MPVYRGIRIKILSQFDFQAYPEYLHPESSQFTYRSSNSRRVSEDCLHPSLSSESKADSLLGRQSMASVYIQSIRGSHFWLRYKFEELIEDQTQIYYLKLVVNGKCMKSWSINARKEPEGQIKQSLYLPSKSWSQVQEKFSWDSKRKRNDGFPNSEKIASFPVRFNGLIELLISVVPDRRHRLPLLSELKILDYQNTFLGHDVLASFQLRNYLNSYPKGPKDELFALFRFYCRDWEFIKDLRSMPTRNLSQIKLNLLSGTHQLDHFAKSQIQRGETDSKISFLHWSNKERNKYSGKSPRNSNTIIFPYLRKSPSSNNLRQTNNETQVPDLSTNYYMAYSKSVQTDSTTVGSVTEVESVDSQDSIGSGNSHPNINSYIIPHQGSLTELNLHHSRSTSSASNTFSITSSLISYEDKNFTSPELVEIGTAAIQLIADKLQTP